MAGRAGPETLAERMVQSRSKRYFIDLQKNAGGRFIKIRTVLESGDSSKLFVPAPGAKAFAAALKALDDRAATLGPFNSAAPEAQRDAEPIFSQQVVVEDKRFYCDLKANQYGRFARVSSVPINGGRGDRSSMIVDESTLGQIVYTISQLVELHDLDADVSTRGGGMGGGSDPSFDEDSCPAPTRVVVGTKRFFLDARNNARGGFVRLSEVEDVRGAKTRNQVVIPSSALPALAAELNKIVASMTGSGHAEVTTLPKEDTSAPRGPPRGGGAGGRGGRGGGGYGGRPQRRRQ